MQVITESTATVTPTGRAGNMLCQLITPGTGASGVYPAETLEAAATDRVFPAGTLLFADHPGEHEAFDRPERSIRDVAGVLVEDARWDGGALVAEAKTFAPWTSVLAEMKDAIGMSIRASAEVGEADPATGKPIVKRLVEGISVDFVTKAGRGGAIREVYESARGRATLMVVDETPAPVPATDPTNIPPIVAEANAEDTHQAIQRAVRTAYATPDGEGRGWLRDFDPDLNLAFIQVSGELVQRTYELNTDGTATLQPDAVRVTARTVYTPIEGSQNSDTTSVPAPVGQSPATESRKDNTMATTQIEESELGRLREDAGRVQALESERDTAVRERDQARQELTESQRRIAARTVIEAQASEHDVTFSPLEERGLLASLPLTENGELDEAAFTETVTAEAARKAEASGAGSVRGFGSSTKVTESKTTSGTNAWDDIDTHLGISKEA